MSQYWNQIADDYQELTHISVEDFHYGPLLAGDKTFGLLPDLQPGARCLELGCGAGQNSLYLANTYEASCTAIDSSEQQLKLGEALANSLGQDIHFIKTELDALPPDLTGPFDLIHSSYGLPFAKDPSAVITRCADLLTPGGTLLLSMGHPLYGGEWLEASPGEIGVFITDYFNIPSDDRRLENGEACEARYYPMQDMAGWLTGAGLQLTALLEPQPLPREQINDMPYHSPTWFENYEEHQHIPVVVILRAVKSMGG